MVDIASISIIPEFSAFAAIPADRLIGPVGLKMTATVTAHVHWESLSVQIRASVANQTFTRTDNGSFITDGFQIADTITVVGGPNAGNYTIAGLTDDVITTVGAPASNATSTVSIYGTTPVNRIRFLNNTVATNSVESYVSLVDRNTTQVKNAYKTTWSVADTVNLAVITNSHGWEAESLTGTDTVERLANINTYTQVFEIVHTFFINPFFINTQLAAIQNALAGNAIPPDWFADTSCLKYLTQVIAGFSSTDTAEVHISSADTAVFKSGNTGWFNEFLNGAAPNYTLESIVYTDVASATVVTVPDLAKDTDVELKIISAAGSFTNVAGPALGSPLILHIMYLPQDESDYVDTAGDFPFNFKYDRRQITIGAAAVDGEQNGTDLQSLTDISATFVDASHCTINFTLSLATVLQTFLQGKDATNRNFLIWVTPQKKVATTLADFDSNAVIGDTQNWGWNQDDATLLTFYDVLFYPYPETTANYFTDCKMWNTDQCFTRHQFLVKDGTQLKDYSIIIEAFKSATDEAFTLEEWAFNFADLYSADYELEIPQEYQRNFKLPDNERNQVQFYRVPGIDTPGNFGYEVDFAFKIRYERWRLLQQFNQDFTATPYQKWSIFSKASGWEVRYRVVANVYDPVADYTTQFIHTANMTISDTTDSDDGLGLGGTITSDVETFVFYGALGYVTTDMFILTDAVTHVVATFTGDFSSFPAGFNAYYGIIYLDVYGSGGENYIDQCSSEETPVDDSFWMAAATVTLVNPTTITVEGDIDPSKLDKTIPQYLFFARLGYKQT